MKALLSVLLSILFLQAQVFALSGGPDYSGGKNFTSIVGTYAGVMTEKDSPVDGTNRGSLVVYSLSIPTSGVSTGAVLIFTEGNVYPGTITGAGDAVSSAFKGIIEAKFNYTYEQAETSTVNDKGVITTTTKFVTKTATVVSNGTVDTQIETVRSGPVSNTLISGTADLLVGPFLAPNLEVLYDVSGYRQIAS